MVSRSWDRAPMEARIVTQSQAKTADIAHHQAQLGASSHSTPGDPCTV